jgi:hypothetical protein
MDFADYLISISPAAARSVPPGLPVAHMKDLF